MYVVFMIWRGMRKTLMQEERSPTPMGEVVGFNEVDEFRIQVVFRMRH